MTSNCMIFISGATVANGSVRMALSHCIDTWTLFRLTKVLEPIIVCGKMPTAAGAIQKPRSFHFVQRASSFPMLHTTEPVST